MFTAMNYINIKDTGGGYQFFSTLSQVISTKPESNQLRIQFSNKKSTFRKSTIETIDIPSYSWCIHSNTVNIYTYKKKHLIRIQYVYISLCNTSQKNRKKTNEQNKLFYTHKQTQRTRWDEYLIDTRINFVEYKQTRKQKKTKEINYPSKPNTSKSGFSSSVDLNEAKIKYLNYQSNWNISLR